MPAPSLVNLACPHCGLESSADIGSLRATKGWSRCPGCSEIFDGFQGHVQGAPSVRPQGIQALPEIEESIKGLPTFFASERGVQGSAAAVAARRPAPKRVGAPADPSARDERPLGQGERLGAMEVETAATPKSNIKTRVYAVSALPRKGAQSLETRLADSAPNEFLPPEFGPSAPVELEAPMDGPMGPTEPWQSSKRADSLGFESLSDSSQDSQEDSKRQPEPESARVGQSSWDSPPAPVPSDEHAAAAERSESLAGLFEYGVLASGQIEPEEVIDAAWDADEFDLDLHLHDIEPILLAKECEPMAAQSLAQPDWVAEPMAADLAVMGSGKLPIAEQRARALAALDGIGASELAWTTRLGAVADQDPSGGDGAGTRSGGQELPVLTRVAREEVDEPVVEASQSMEAVMAVEPMAPLAGWSAPGKGRDAAAVEAFAQGESSELDFDLAEFEGAEQAQIYLSTQAMGLWLDESSKARAEAAAKESANKRMESIAAKGAGPKAQARARVLAVPAPERNKPVVPMLAKTAIEALSLARAARFNPFAAAKMLPSLSKRQWIGYGGTAFALILALMLQSAWFGRGEASARSLGSKAMWHSICSKLGCSVLLPQARANLELEGADVRSDASGRLIFTAALKSSAEFESQAPNLWLSIEGPGGKILASKTFEPKAWLGAESIQAGASLDSQLAFDPLSSPPEGFKAQLLWAQER